MALVDINWHPSPKELRVFAILEMAFFSLVAWWIADRWAAPRTAAVILVLAGGAGVAGLGRPSLLRPVYVVWMMAVLPIGWTISHLAMAGIYYLVVTPIGLIMRLGGHDPMHRRFDRAARSYWRARPPEARKGRYFRQF